MSDLIANPPSHELAKKLVNDAPKPKRFPTTTYVRTAVAAAIVSDNYLILIDHYKGGDVTGSSHADVYFLAKELVQWETEAERYELANALKAGKIQLVDIVKRLTPELRKLKFEVERGVILGTRIAAVTPVTNIA